MVDTPAPTGPPVLPGARTGRDPERSIRRGPRRIPQELVAATQRERLLDGVSRTVAARGYAGARISDICRTAGVTRPVFYEQFTGKEDAVLAAYRLGVALVLQSMEYAYEQAGGGVRWPVAVRAGLEALLSILASNPSFAAMLVEVEGVGAAGRAERERLLGRFCTFFTDAPAGPAGAARGELVDALVGAVHSALYRRIAQGDTEGLPKLLPTLVCVVLSPFPAVVAESGEL
ncbi:TetR/AcrR family transcriptional regulator [Streptomyces tsukubensis]|uniref:TetR family transcriptional regulator n=1 Tax=Streptomyces tsukubensis TaxID=83656 RepID=A0A1V4AFL1_9ACTN|nr:TetR/AcrR family transcriptional regulator [Streptomyces tsukubensis]OON82806.1 TetR family transcriptional regulator [Streptomyces tsukubensis]QFR92018.1 TetR family transcriptional regulator [Streptomyces tsukubensis]